tara:strand:+ start:1750 stop:2016 length:267 start_codon:yes stop_codon:yes gene_type:complete
MDKIKKPNAQEVFDMFLLALQDEQVKLAGDIGGFKIALYDGFKSYTYRKKYTEEMLYEYIEEALDAILDDEQAMQQTDYMHAQKPAGI